MKACNRCGIEKQLTDFYRSKLGRLGVRSACKACELAEKAKQRQANPEAWRHKSARWRKDNPLKARSIWRSYADRNREKRLAERKAWRAKNLDKDRAREKRYLKNNRPIVYAKNGRRRAAETRAVPRWLNWIQKAQIQEFYEIAMARTMQTGEKHHVDHIVPLRGNGVFGLHVPWNLQILTEFENCSKHNKVLEARN